jgi:Dyp-type peroxidase family
MKPLQLDLEEIQGDILEGLQKNAEAFLFFRIVNPIYFKHAVTRDIAGSITSAQEVNHGQMIIERRKKFGQARSDRFHGVNLGFTRHGLTELLGSARMELDPSFDRGADHQDTIEALNDPPRSTWLKTFIADRIDGVFLITGPDQSSARFHSNELLRSLGSSIKLVHWEIGKTRPGAERGHEHFGFLDGVSQPGIRGLPSVSYAPDNPGQGRPGRDLIWPGEFVFGYPGQHGGDPVTEGPAPEMPETWMRNGSYMVFRRLEQKVPEFRRFVAERGARLGMDPQLLATRMVGRWRSGAPLELAPLRDNPALGGDKNRNNNFGFAGDPVQRKCPYAAHIRKAYPRDDIALAEAQRHRIIRRGIPFGPEVAPSETTTRYSRGLMFVCYQTSIERQFEYIQKNYANNPAFVGGRERPGGGGVVAPGFDPIIGQAEWNGTRQMDEPFPNYPSGNRRTTLEIPQQFVVLTAAAYFFMPSITALRTVLTQ